MAGENKKLEPTWSFVTVSAAMRHTPLSACQSVSSRCQDCRKHRVCLVEIKLKLRLVFRVAAGFRPLMRAVSQLKRPTAAHHLKLAY